MPCTSARSRQAGSAGVDRRGVLRRPRRRPGHRVDRAVARRRSRRPPRRACRGPSANPVETWVGAPGKIVLDTSLKPLVAHDEGRAPRARRGAGPAAASPATPSSPDAEVLHPQGTPASSARRATSDGEGVVVALALAVERRRPEEPDVERRRVGVAPGGRAPPHPVGHVDVLALVVRHPDRRVRVIGETTGRARRRVLHPRGRRVDSSKRCGDSRRGVTCGRWEAVGGRLRARGGSRPGGRRLVATTEEQVARRHPTGERQRLRPEGAEQQHEQQRRHESGQGPVHAGPGGQGPALVRQRLVGVAPPRQEVVDRPLPRCGSGSRAFQRATRATTQTGSTTNSIVRPSSTS